MGVLPYIVVLDELLLLTQNLQRKATQKKFFKKTTNFAPACYTNQVTKTNSYTYIQLQFITNGGTPSISPGLQSLLNSSSVATVFFTRPSGRYIF